MSDWDVVPTQGSFLSDPQPAPSQPTPATSQPAVLTLDSELSVDALQRLFPDRDPAKVRDWVGVLQSEEIRRVRDAAALLSDDHKEEWNSLKLPLAVKAALREALLTALRTPQSDPSKAEQSPEQQQPDTAPSEGLPSRCKQPSIKQLDCIVLDISQSMKSRSVIDDLKTREDVSKLMFHTMVDRILSLEMDHAVGLVAFGAGIHVVKGLTMQYEAFHEEMGRLDARESSTRLFDAIQAAADMMLAFAANTELDASCPRRIFALTDGEDNASLQPAWRTTAFLQERGIILDALPLGPANPTLQAMASATGGYCLDVTSERQAIDLFQREALLHVPLRGAQVSPRRVDSEAALRSFISGAAVVQDVAPVQPAAVQAPVMSKAAVEQKMATAPSSGSSKRILKEYAAMQQEASSQHFVFMCEGDIYQWKAVIQSPEKSVYGQKWFVATLVFPSDYPFKPPKFRFATKMFHPNINNDGAVCIDILKDGWSPALTIGKLLLSIQSLLTDPNADDPLDPWKAQLYKSDRPRYDKEAREHAEKHGFTDLGDALTAYGISPQ